MFFFFFLRHWLSCFRFFCGVGAPSREIKHLEIFWHLKIYQTGAPAVSLLPGSASPAPGPEIGIFGFHLARFSKSSNFRHMTFIAQRTSTCVSVVCVAVRASHNVVINQLDPHNLLQPLGTFTPRSAPQAVRYRLRYRYDHDQQ